MQLSVLGALEWSPALGGALRHLHVRGAPRPPHLGWSHQCHPCPPDLGGTISPCAPVLRGQLCKSRAGSSPGLSFSLHIVFCRRIYLVFLLIIRSWGLPARISAPSPDRACSCCHPCTRCQCGVLRGDILPTRTWPGVLSIPPAAGTLSHTGIPPGQRELPCSRTPKQPLGLPCSHGFGKKGIWE